MDKKIYNNLIFSSLLTVVFTFMDFAYSVVNNDFVFKFMTWSVIWLFFMSMMLSVVSNSKLRKFFLFLIIMASMSQYLHFDYFGVNIIGIEIYMILTEAGEAASTIMSTIIIMLPSFIITIVAIVLVFWLDKRFYSKNLHSKFGTYLLTFTIIYQTVSTFFIINYNNDDKVLERTLNKRIYPVTGQNSALNTFNSLFQFLMGVVPDKILSKSKGNFPIATRLKKSNKDIDYNIVFVLGESLRYDHLSLFNYKFKTTPRLDKYKNDDNFHVDWVYSAATMSKTALAGIFNILKYPGLTRQVAKQNHCLFKNAKQNNFETFFMSAQKEAQLDIVQSVICRKYIDNYADKEDLEEMLGKKNPYDDDLLEILKTFDLEKGNKFIVLHQRGSHTPYELRYPKSDKNYKFSPYDNTILHTDLVLDNIIKYIKTINKKTYFIYVSDHGELLLDEEGRRGHGWFEYPVITVPMIITSNKKLDFNFILSNIRSHYDISLLLAKLLGYDVSIEDNKNKKIYISGTDFDAFDGYMLVDIKDNKEIIDFSNVEGEERKSIVVNRNEGK